MSLVREVRIHSKPVASFADVLGRETVDDCHRSAERLKQKLRGRVIWNVNSTAAIGGVAEMLHTLLSYARGVGIDTRWLVVGGGPDFFRITKRLQNALHGERGDGSALDRTAREIYDLVSDRNAAELAGRIHPDDVVILHDPQTAGLIPHLARRGVAVIWRCYMGNDGKNSEADRGWAFLEPYLKQANAFIFSRFSYLPEFLYHGRCLIVPPTIDPFSPKNQELDAASVRAILHHLGVLDGSPGNGARTFVAADGSTRTVEGKAEIVRQGPPPAQDTPLVVQVARWARLKDPAGTMQGFTRSLASVGRIGAQLLLVGPGAAADADDPEAAEVFRDTVAAWKKLPEDTRCRVHLVRLPMEDLQENAAMVNAIQRHATLVVQKSLREGFGLTVTEAMWKSLPVIASAVGGIQDQIEHGVSGLLLRNPADLDAFAGAITQVLGNRGFAERMGRNAHRRVSQNYLGLSIVAQFDDLVERVRHERHDPAA